MAAHALLLQLTKRLKAVAPPPDVQLAAVGTNEVAALHAAITSVWAAVQQYGVSNVALLQITDVSAEEHQEDYLPAAARPPTG